MTPVYAHTKADTPESAWHLLVDHLSAVGRLAGMFAADFNATDWAEAAGDLHDAGKATAAFQRYLRLCAQGKGVRGSAPHAVYGARLALDRHKAFGKLLAYAIYGHHGGLPDYGTLEQRLDSVQDMEQLANFVPEAFPAAFPLPGAQNHSWFRFSFFIRMLFSCLVDADWLDTEAFLDAEKASWRTGAPQLAALSTHFFAKMHEKFSGAENSEVNRIRNEVRRNCEQAALWEPGLFSLTVPTGGGKTLASLAFALRHAEKYGLKRIIYVIPYMSIIEQNAGVFREFLGPEAVVEHHSAYDPDQSDAPDSDDESDDKSARETQSVRRRIKLACENWDAPLVATTAVQFFESLFANKPSRCRKVHNLAKSVIILDEAQMLPRHVLLPCLAAIGELASNYGASVVLCTATQPAVNKRDNFPQGLEAREMIPDPAALYQRLRRVSVRNLGELDDEQLCRRLEAHDQALCIVNSRRHAAALFGRLRHKPGVFHLSGNMTAAHRSRTITAIKSTLKKGAPCLVISTSLVECGVDFSFPVVYRALAGLDSLAQAAGRCDREGELTAAAGAPAGEVFVFTATDAKDPLHLKDFVQKAEEVIALEYADLLAPEAIEKYFQLLYWEAGEEGLDKYTIMKQLTDGTRKLNFPFRTVAEEFRLIEQEQLRTLLVPFDDYETIMRQVASLAYAKSPRTILRTLQAHTIQIRSHQIQELLRHNRAAPVLDGQIEGFYVLLEAQAYDPEQGFFLCDTAKMDPLFG